MNGPVVGKHNVGRIAERIVANELEYWGFRVSDLNKEGTSANADLLAVKEGNPWQIQVKGASQGGHSPWINYGYCDQAIIDRQDRMFNRHAGFYRAQIVVLVSVMSPSEYTCVILPLEVAERAAQMNLDYAYRTSKRDGSPKRPGKVWAYLNYVPRVKDTSRAQLIADEQQLLRSFVNKWDFMN